MDSPSLHTLLDLSHKRNVYAVGDIHGEFELVQDKLTEIGFDYQQDALVSVGDLCDRGPDSEAAFEWIRKDWFFRSLGNHDVMPYDFVMGQKTRDEVKLYGGQWFLNKQPDERQMIAHILADAPVCLTVLTPGGRRIGIAHADCLKDWDEQIASLDPTKPKHIWVKDLTLESRHTFKMLLNAQKEKRPFDVEAARVANIDHVVHGHTIIGKKFTCANRTWIDTGAYKGGEITIVNLDKLDE